MASAPHEVLGVRPDASHKQIRRAYKRLARRYHPDANPSAGATAKFLAVKAAHDEMLRILDGGPAPRRRPEPRPEPSRSEPRPPPRPDPPRPRPQPETIRPDAKFTRPDLPPWLDVEQDPIRNQELGRFVLYTGAAVFWLMLFGVLIRTLQGMVAPEEPMEVEEDAVVEQPRVRRPAR